MQDAVNKLRDLLNDNLESNEESQEYLSGDKVFALQYPEISSATLVVKKNGTTWASSNYSYSSTTNKITVTGTLIAGDVLTFTYSTYKKYTTTELQGRIRSALYYIAAEQYRVFMAKPNNTIYPTPNDSEFSLIAIVAAILINGCLSQYKTPEFTMIFDTDKISMEKRIKRVCRQYKKTFGVYDYVDMKNKQAELEVEDE
jgi:hypothetical protein